MSSLTPINVSITPTDDIFKPASAYLPKESKGLWQSLLHRIAAIGASVGVPIVCLSLVNRKTKTISNNNALMMTTAAVFMREIIFSLSQGVEKKECDFSFILDQALQPIRDKSVVYHAPCKEIIECYEQLLNLYKNIPTDLKPADDEFHQQKILAKNEEFSSKLFELMKFLAEVEKQKCLQENQNEITLLKNINETQSEIVKKYDTLKKDNKDQAEEIKKLKEELVAERAAKQIVDTKNERLTRRVEELETRLDDLTTIVRNLTERLASIAPTPAAAGKIQDS